MILIRTSNDFEILKYQDFFIIRATIIKILLDRHKNAVFYLDHWFYHMVCLHNRTGRDKSVLILN